MDDVDYMCRNVIRGISTGGVDMKIAINRCYGGFGLSEALFNELGIPWDGYGKLRNESFAIEDDYNYRYRAYPKLIAAIEKVGEEQSNGKYAEVRIINIPDGVEWVIDEYDGYEEIHEAHRRWP